MNVQKKSIANTSFWNDINDILMNKSIENVEEYIKQKSFYQEVLGTIDNFINWESVENFFDRYFKTFELITNTAATVFMRFMYEIKLKYCCYNKKTKKYFFNNVSEIRKSNSQAFDFKDIPNIKRNIRSHWREIPALFQKSAIAIQKKSCI